MQIDPEYGSCGLLSRACVALTFTIHVFKSIETSTKKAGKVLYRAVAFVEAYSLPPKNQHSYFFLL